MKKSLFLIVCLSAVISSNAQVKLDCGLEITPEQALGLDRPYDFTPAKLSPAPKGYKEFFIEHYGRHGSRYAYSSKYYKSANQYLTIAKDKNLLTDLGKRIQQDFSTHYETYLLRMGDLAPLGREQQEKIAQTMCKSFPKAFSGNPEVRSSGSLTLRSVMSMSAFDLGLKGMNPKLDIEEETGRVFLNGTNPRIEENPFRVERYCPPFPFEEKLEHFLRRKLDPKVILSKLFIDPDAVCPPEKQADFVLKLYTLVAGMNSIPEAERTDFSGLFSEREFALMCEVNTYSAFNVYYTYFPKCIPVLLDIEQDASRRIQQAKTGATCRFGHDHVMVPLLILLQVNGSNSTPASPDQTVNSFHLWDSCMSTNLQFIFYRPAGKPAPDRILFKLLLNGVESTLPLPAIQGCYYRFEDLQTYLCRLQEQYPVLSK